MSSVVDPSPWRIDDTAEGPCYNDSVGTIIQLPEDVAIKIAAGEVVERPASVVKELVENSLDAKAKRITITLRQGGKNFIEVTDNGSGLEPADAVRAFLRHGTSKITSLDDLFTLTTLGFRGEALAAIAVSGEGELATAPPRATIGTRVRFRRGVIGEPQPHPPISGTRVQVADLFADLPARQKFLKSDATEWKTSMEVLAKQMLAHPSVGFRVTHNERTVVNFGSHTLMERAAALWHCAQTDLVDVRAAVPHLTLEGVVMKPEASHRHSGKPPQFLAVNGHPVGDRIVARSVKDALGTNLPGGMLPAYALRLTLHPGMVDVNIHPRKEEVRFINPQAVFRFVFQAVEGAVARAGRVFEEIPQNIAISSDVRLSPASPAAALSLANHREKRPMSPAIFPRDAELGSTEAPTTLVLGHCYLVTIQDDNLVIIDQHAAHERVLYEQFWTADRQQNSVSQTLLLPAVLELGEAEAARLGELKDGLTAIGFKFTDRSPPALLEVPRIVRQADPVALILAVLGHAADRLEPELTSVKHRLYATLACKAAVKAGDTLRPIERGRLISDLATVSNQFTCPHGRPSHVRISPEELAKLFKRTGF